MDARALDRTGIGGCHRLRRAGTFLRRRPARGTALVGLGDRLRVRVAHAPRCGLPRVHRPTVQ